MTSECGREALQQACKVAAAKGREKEKAPNDPLNYTQVLPVLHWEGRWGEERKSNVIWNGICVK